MQGTLKNPIPKTCEECRTRFMAITKNQVYCTKACSNRRNMRKLKEVYESRKAGKLPMPEKKCRQCGLPFQTTGGKRYCSDVCRETKMIERIRITEEKRKARRKRKEKPGAVGGIPIQIPEGDRTFDGRWFDMMGMPHYAPPRGKYVYGWYAEDEQLPFYVGQGYWNRGWIAHYLDDGDRALCERVRTKKTRVLVYRSNLTDEGALLIESVLVRLFRSMGAQLTNQCEPMKRKEAPPLEKEPEATDQLPL